MQQAQHSGAGAAHGFAFPHSLEQYHSPRRSKLCDAALASMAALTRLTELSLSGLSNRKVSDAAIGAALQHMPLLEKVNLWYCRQVC